MKGALRGVVASFVGGVAEEDEEEVGEEDGTQVSEQYCCEETSRLGSLQAVLTTHHAQVYAAGPKSASLAPEDVQNLAAWYQHRFGKLPASPKNGKAPSPGPNLVVLLEDLEAFDGKVLGAVIETLRCAPALLVLLRRSIRCGLEN